MRLARAIGMTFFCMTAFLLFQKIATIPVEAFTRSQPHFAHYYYVVDGDGTLGVSTFIVSLFFFPFWLIGWTSWNAIRMTVGKPWWMDFAVFFGTAAAFDLILSGDMRGELPMMLPILLAQSFLASSVLTVFFRPLNRLARIDTGED